MRQSPHHLPDELERASADFDILIRDVRAGIRDVRHYDELEERVHAICNRAVRAFRGSQARPTNADIVPGRKSGVWAR